MSVGGLRCQYPEGHQASHGYRGAQWSVGRTSPGDTIRRITRDWLGFKPTPDHLAQLEDAVNEAVDALEDEHARLRDALANIGREDRLLSPSTLRKLAREALDA